MTPKMLVAAIAALAIAAGFALPAPGGHEADGRSLIPTLEIGKG